MRETKVIDTDLLVSWLLHISHGMISLSISFEPVPRYSSCSQFIQSMQSTRSTGQPFY